MKRLVFFAIGAAAACNAITGAHDRVLADTEVEDAGQEPRDRDAPEDTGMLEPVDAAALDVAVDVNSIETIRITGNDSWGTPNDAGFTTSAAGIEINSAAPGAAHAVVVPLPMPPLPTSNFTVIAAIDVKEDKEFALITRMQRNGTGIVIASRLSNGTRPDPFLAPMGPPEWAPILPYARGPGTAYDFVLPSRYYMKLVAQDDVVAGKMWREGDPEPTVQAIIQDPTTPAERGRGVGFYEYLEQKTTLAEVTITYVKP